MKALPRLYPILDIPTLARRGCTDWTMVANAMLSGGAEILQFRHKDEWTRAVFEEAEQIAEKCRSVRVAFVVNDRADMSKLLQAGLHVGQQDLSPTDCRIVVGDETLLGYSTHNSEQLGDAATQPVDYVAFGPIFATTSKENPDPVAGLDRLASARAQTAKPLVAIGGITRDTAASVFAAGADSVAIIGDLLPETLTESAIRNRMEEWQRLTRM